MNEDALAPSDLSEAVLREPLRRILSSRERRRLAPAGTTAAAVLVALFEQDGEAHVWLVRRPASMRSHAGQVAFPGGKKDERDASLLVTALREAHEELGIAAVNVDVLGPLDDLWTGTGFTITPWVGWLASGAQVTPNPGEVARAFSPALRSFLMPSNGPPPRRGWTIDGEIVWGATAAIVEGFVRVLHLLDRAGPHLS